MLFRSNGEDDDCDGQTDEASCDDKNACTQDGCEGAKGCVYKPLDGDPCDADGTVCTVNDSCKAGVCVAGGKKDCDDKNPCTQDSCDLAKGCTQVADDGKPCDADGTACTAGDTCQGGGCKAGNLTVCDDGNPCTTDTCAAGCQHVNNTLPCADDGNPCTSDACVGGSCGHPAKVNGDPCDNKDNKIGRAHV